MSNQNVLIGKSLVLGIFILFICLSINSSVATDSSYRNLSDLNILYVGGSGEGNYSKIQDAIDNATDGDTVFVFNGSYNENLQFQKSLYLIGEDREKTIIDGCGSLTVVSLEMMAFVEFVIIRGFTIQNGRTGINYDTGIDNLGENPNFIGKTYPSSAGFFDNIIINNEIGIGVGWWSENIDIYNNQIIQNEIGILLDPSSWYNWISENNIIQNNYGICAEGSYFCEIFENLITMNNINGLSLSYSYGYTISDNTISSNDKGIYLYSSEVNNIEGNEIFENNVGTKLDSYSNYNEIKCNNFSNNKRRGLYIYDSNNNDILDNTISNNKDGILICNSSSNNVSCNKINDNIFGLDIYNISKHNTILGNHISNNYYGLIIGNPILPRISIQDDLDGSNFNNIIKNNFCKNTYGHAIFDGCWTNNWKENYWGRPRVLPKIIHGRIFLFPWFNFDWHPAKEPYDI